MNLFLDLAEDHQRTILGCWLDNEDILAFDSAVCSHKFRSQFLAMLASPKTVLRTWTCDHNFAGDSWVVHRSLHYAELFLRGTLNLTLRDAVLASCGNAVKTLHIHTAAALRDGDQYNQPVVPSEYDTDEYLPALLGVVVGHCSQITELSIYCGESDEASFSLTSWDNLVALIAANAHLQSLSLSYGQEVTTDTMRAIYSAPNLTSLDLCWCTFAEPLTSLPPEIVNENITTVGCFSGDHFLDVCCRFPNVTTLTGSTVEADELVQLSLACPLLQRLELSFGGELNDDCALSLASTWSGLRRLVMNNVDAIACSEEAALIFIQHCPLLQYLNLCEVNSDRIQRPPVLTEEGESQEEGRDEEAALDLRDDLAGPGSHLQVLRVESLTEAGLVTVLERCKHLHTLGIYHTSNDVYNPVYMQKSADRALHHLANSSVRTLHMQNPGPLALTDANLAALRGLEELCIAHTDSYISSEALVALASRCPSLHTLCAVVWQGITRECVLPILQHCPNLRSLELFTEGPPNHEEVRWLMEEVREGYPLLEYVVLQLNE